MTTTRQRGFTLIETIAAIVILLVAVPPMLWAVRAAVQDRVNPMLASRARWLATEKLEDIIADRHSTGTRGWGHLIAGNYGPEDYGTMTGYEQFKRTVSLNETQADLTTPDSNGGYMNVTVTVEWSDANGQTRSWSIRTVLTEFPP